MSLNVNKKNMKRVEFNTPDEFTSYFSEKNVEITKAVVSAIKEALESQKKTAVLFEVYFDSMDVFYELSLTRNQWQTALENCLSHFEQWNMSDDAIDTYLLIKDLDKW